MNQPVPVSNGDEAQRELVITSLQLQIEQSKTKIRNYQELEKELKQVCSSINKGAQGKLGGQNKSHKQLQQRLHAAKSSNKKIKIYELQKKLKKITSQWRDKESIKQRYDQRQKDLMREIDNKGKIIDEEKRRKESLVEIQLNIIRNLERTSDQMADQQRLLNESLKRKEMFSLEKTKIKDQLKRLKKFLRNVNGSSQEYSFDLSLSLSQQNGQIHKTHQFKRQWESKLVVDQSWFEQERERAEKIFSRLEESRQQNGEMVGKLYRLKNQFVHNQTMVNHHQLTVFLQTSQLKQYQQKIDEGRLKIALLSEQTEKSLGKVKRLEGQRGSTRGLVGVLTERIRLIRGVKLFLQGDIENLRQLCDYLRLLKGLLTS